MTTKDIVRKASAELNIPYTTVWNVYEAYWKFIRNHISSLPLKEDITEEEFSKLKTSINVPSLGKFHLDWDRLCIKKKEHERFKHKKAETDVHNGADNT